jgi:hypothetical protein
VQGGGEHGLAADRRRQPARALLGAAELRDGQAAQNQRRQERHWRQVPPRLLQDEADLQNPQVAAAERLGQGQPRNLGPAELRPQRVVEPFAVRLQRLRALVAGAVGEDPSREVAHRLLLFAVREVHVAR